MCDRNPIQCIIPSYINEKLAESSDPAVRAVAMANLKAAAAFRAVRVVSQAMPRMFAAAAPAKKKHRLVYTAGNTPGLPGTLVRSEGQAKSTDAAVNEAYDHSGTTYDFYDKLFGRNSLDDAGMTLTSSVHVAEYGVTGNVVPMNNAFWDGSQMAYGDGDGVIFQRFTRALDVVGHELTHGVISFTSNLRYFGQSGALNEHFADVFGVLIRQWKKKQPVAKADWLIGADVIKPTATRRALRDMKNPGKAFVNDPDIGTDPQPAHMKNYYTGPRDRQGVHINSGIPNRAFVLAAQALGGNAWVKAGRIWYDTMVRLTDTSVFVDCKRESVQVADALYGASAKKAVADAWKAVGV